MTDPKASPPARPLARSPRGFPDRDAHDIAGIERMMAAIRKVYESYGYEAVETPFVEYADALGKFLPDQDRPNEGVFAFRDDDGQWLSLRYDLTAPLARHVAENYDRLPKPYRSYRSGWVFRNEKPGPGRFRQFLQFDADIVGSGSVAADAEIAMMAADTLEALGVPRGQYVIKVNDRRILDGVMEAIGLGGSENAGRRLTVLRAIDKLDRLRVDGVRQLLGAGRKDESGDFTKGAGLRQAQIDLVVAIAIRQSGSLTALEEITKQPTADWADRATPQSVMTFSSADNENKSFFIESNKGVLDDLEQKFTNPISRTGIGALRAIAEMAKAAGYGFDRIRIDPSVVRRLEYYTGPVFEAELLIETKDEKGQPVRFGSVGGGGRYDGLVGRFRGEDVPATGFSIGVSRLYAALKLIGSPIVTGERPDPLVVVTVMDEGHMADYQAMAAELRAAGESDPVFRTDVYLGAGRFGAQMKYADRRGAAVAVIQGADERAQGVVQIKDLILGATLSGAKDRADYKALQAQAQFAVPRDGLVAAVREVIARRS